MTTLRLWVISDSSHWKVWFYLIIKVIKNQAKLGSAKKDFNISSACFFDLLWSKLFSGGETGYSTQSPSTCETLLKYPSFLRYLDRKKEARTAERSNPQMREQTLHSQYILSFRIWSPEILTKMKTSISHGGIAGETCWKISWQVDGMMVAG